MKIGDKVYIVSNYYEDRIEGVSYDKAVILDIKGDVVYTDHHEHHLFHGCNRCSVTPHGEKPLFRFCETLIEAKELNEKEDYCIWFNQAFSNNTLHKLSLETFREIENVLKSNKRREVS